MSTEPEPFEPMPPAALRGLLCAALCLAVVAPARSAHSPIEYTLDLRNPESHVIRVVLVVSQAGPGTAIQFPAWNALYQIRDFVRDVQDLTASCDGRSQSLYPVDVDTWRTGRGSCARLEVHYAVFVHGAPPFSCAFDPHHAFMNFAELLFYLPAERKRAASIRFALPAGWKVATLLEDGAAPGEFRAADYDDLADRPAEAGNFQLYQYRQSGALYRIVVDADPGTYPAARLVDSIEKITGAETALMRDVPFSRYTFILHFAGRGGGGMEHAYGTAISFPTGRLAAGWLALEATVAHEFFHLWNVKRIRPRGLEPVDYIHGNDTRDLWFSEGLTSTYQELVLLRSGLDTPQTFYDRVARQITALQGRPARHFQSLELSGVDAWLEGYPDYLRPERSISYYNKGELAGFLLDLAMRQASDDRSGLDDLMRRLNQDFAKRGRFFDDRDLIGLIRGLSRFDAAPFFRDYVTGTRGLDYQTYLGYAGLQLVQRPVTTADWGFQASRSFGGAIIVDGVEPGSAAEKGGLRTGDLIEALNGRPAIAPPGAISGLKPGEKVSLEIQRGEQRTRLRFRLGSRSESAYAVEEQPHATRRQLEIRQGWLEGKAGP